MLGFLSFEKNGGMPGIKSVLDTNCLCRIVEQNIV